MEPPLLKKKKSWKAVISQFNEIIGRKYDKGQLKNKWVRKNRQCSISYLLKRQVWDKIVQSIL